MKNNKSMLICLAGALMILMSGCSKVTETVNDLSSWEKERIFCVEGQKIWVLERGNSERINITSQIVGTCDVKEKAE